MSSKRWPRTDHGARATWTIVGEQDQPARPEVPPEGQDVLGHERVPLRDGVTRGVERDDLLEQPTAPLEHEPVVVRHL